MTETISIPQFDLTGRVALITGASSGFGAYWARLLAAAGAKVVITARRAEKLEEVRRTIEAAGGIVHAIALDVADDAGTAAAYDEAERVFGTVDTIIANAGVTTATPATEMSGDEFSSILDTNLRGVFLTAREGARRLIAAGSTEKKNGRIVIVGSITARKIYSGTAAYSASKAAAGHLGRMLASEWVRSGINVNVILPGYFPTEMTGAHQVAMDYLVKRFPRQRLGTISAMDVPLLFFCSDLSAQVTGSELVIDDGQIL